MYCSFRRSCRILAALAALALSACRRQAAQPAIDRIAILRFENLSSDVSADWMGRAFSEVLTAELRGVPGIYPVPSNRLHNYDRVLGARPISSPGISAERTQALLANAHHIGYGEYTIRGGRLEAQLTVEDPRARTMTKVIRASAPAGDVIAAATELARQMGGGAAPYGTRNPQALRAYIAGLEGGDPAAIEVAYNLAMTADPDFAMPYEALAQIRAQRQDRTGALALLQRAAARGNSIPELERARMDVLTAEIGADPAALEKALTWVVKLDPADSASWRALGDSARGRHEYRLSLQAYQRAAELEPEDAGLLNTLGYAGVYAGELDTGMAALRRYQALSPNDANPLDSMGDINLAAGRLSEAGSFYLQAQKKDPNFAGNGEFLKAAMAHLMAGDIAGADGLAKQYVDARTAAKDPAAAYRQAEWQWAAGRRKAAYQQLSAFAAGAQNGPLRELASRADAELAFWALMLGNRDAAAKTAQQALALAGPSSIGLAVVAQFVSQPPASPAEWISRADQKFSAPGQASLKENAAAYALLLNQQFQAAQPLLKHIWDAAPSTADEGLPTLLAWTYLETGRLKDAEPLLQFNPVPTAAVLGPFSPFYFPRLFYLRGVAAEKQGKRDEARNNYQIFLKLSGPDPLMWGEEKKALESK